MRQTLLMLKEKYGEIDAGIADFTRVFRTFLPNIFKEEIFDKYPHVESVSWNQYTPYFNDGDSCYFSVDSYYGSVLINDKLSYEVMEELGIAGAHHNLASVQGVPPELTAYLDFQRLLGSFPDDVWERAFGDHVSITIHRDSKVEISEYEHD